MHYPHILSTWTLLIFSIQFFWQGLVFLYVEKLEASLNWKNISHYTSKEEVFRYILTLHSLLENPPGDYPDNIRQDLVKGFVRICSFIRYILIWFEFFLLLLSLARVQYVLCLCYFLQGRGKNITQACWVY